MNVAQNASKYVKPEWVHLLMFVIEYERYWDTHDDGNGVVKLPWNRISKWFKTKEIIFMGAKNLKDFELVNFVL